MDALMIDELRHTNEREHCCLHAYPSRRSGCDPVMITALIPDEGSFDIPTRVLDCNDSVLVLEPELTSYDFFLFPGMDNSNWFSYKSTASRGSGDFNPVSIYQCFICISYKTTCAYPQPQEAEGFRFDLLGSCLSILRAETLHIDA